MLLGELRKMLSTRPINHAHLVQAVALQKALNLLDVIIALEGEKLEPTKDFLLFNKHVLSVVDMVRRLVSHVILVAVMVKSKLMKT